MKCESILIIDDDEGIREMLLLTLELYGYKVFTAQHGKDAFEKLKSIPLPCLILLDLMMPVMDGWEFLEELRKSNLANMTFVVVLSAFLDQTKIRPVVAQALLRKPIDLSALLSLAEHHTGMKAEDAKSHA